MRSRLSEWRRVGHETDTGDDGSDATVLPFAVADDDPLIAHVLQHPGTVAIDELDLDSPALEAMRAGGVEAIVPLISHGEVIGVLNLGPRRSERPYSLDDRRLLDNLAGNAASAIRVAHLVRDQREQARTHARIDQELQVARDIQLQFLPREIPAPSGWNIVPHYQPAREVGGDFYDFISLPDGQIGLVVGDVTDKGVPAAMVMATTHSILRTDAPRLVEPGAVLARANDLLCDEMPPNMFVTCLYAVLNPSTGHLRFANAGHNLPCIRTDAGAVEPRATGMPLGMLPGLHYEEAEATIAPASSFLLYSDGIIEAHSPSRELYGFPRMRALVGASSYGDALVQAVLDDLWAFTGARWEQEDDITLVSIARSSTADAAGDEPDWLASFEVPSVLGNERVVADRVVTALASLRLPSLIADRLRTVVAEVAMNAIEHGNECQESIPVRVRVAADATSMIVEVVDQGGGVELAEPESPDIDAKLAGDQSPRGWGMFLIRSMVDSLDVTSDGAERTVRLRMSRTGPEDRSE